MYDLQPHPEGTNAPGSSPSPEIIGFLIGRSVNGQVKSLPQDPFGGGYQIQTAGGPLIFSKAEVIGKEVRQVSRLYYDRLIVLIQGRIETITARQKEDREEVDRLKSVLQQLQRVL